MFVLTLMTLYWRYGLPLPNSYLLTASMAPPDKHRDSHDAVHTKLFYEQDTNSCSFGCEKGFRNSLPSVPFDRGTLSPYPINERLNRSLSCNQLVLPVPL